MLPRKRNLYRQHPTKLGTNTMSSHNLIALMTTGSPTGVVSSQDAAIPVQLPQRAWPHWKSNCVIPAFGVQTVPWTIIDTAVAAWDAYRMAPARGKPVIEGI